MAPRSAPLILLGLAAACDALMSAARPRAARPALRMGAEKTWSAADIDWTASHISGQRDIDYGPLLGEKHNGKYCESLREVVRRKTRTVTAGPVSFGSDHKIVRQTMGTTSTRDVAGTIDQVMRCSDAGFDLFRLTVVGMKEATACHDIREGLFKKGYDIPLCADMHFQPKVAMKTAEAVEKIRINPGNFADGRKVDEDTVSYETEEDYLRDRDNIVEQFAPLVLKCKELNRAMRIGTNHGSLSARVLSFFGDSSRGMVESAVEFADICRSLDYHNFVFSMKASNPVVMIQGYRLLAAEQYRLGWDYPLHLGVTEAGEGEDGRMKSAIGIGTLLGDGLGDTIRVSLTEDPEYEYAPCNRLAELSEANELPPAKKAQLAVPAYSDTRDVTMFDRRRGFLPAQREGDQHDYRGLLHRDGSVLSFISTEELKTLGELGPFGASALFRALGAKTVDGPGGASLPMKDVATTDTLFLREPPAIDDEAARDALKTLRGAGVHCVVPLDALAEAPLPGAVPAVDCAALGDDATLGKLPLASDSGRMVVTCRGGETDEQLAALRAMGDQVDFVLAETDPSLSRLHATRRLFEKLGRGAPGDEGLSVVHHLRAPECDRSELALQLGMQAGGLLGDGLGDGVLVEPEVANTANFDVAYLRDTSFALLQGSRMRNTKTEFVSCPSCGRTLFDLQEVTAQISEKTGHLPGVAIAIMGCIVNGPGEMADADFGYVGTVPGKIDLYVGKTVVEKGIPDEIACDALIQLIKDNGKWVDKEDDEDEDETESDAPEVEEPALTEPLVA